MSRPRSFWGWGYADRFPDITARRAIAVELPHQLGFAAGDVAEPVALEAIEIPTSSLSIPPGLQGIVSTATADRIRHAYGRAYPDVLRGFRGDFSPVPDAVAYPRSEAEILAILDWATGARVAVIPYGGGTSVVGGIEASVGSNFTGTLSLDLAHLDAVLEVDPVSNAARIQAGAKGPRLEEQLAAAGRTLRFYPQSFEFSTLGGWIATRAGGHFATVHTHIDDLVESTRTLTARGILETQRLPGSGAGPSPDRWILGSEGTLGVISEAWVRILPRPSHRATATVRFAEFWAAVDAVRAIAQSGLNPSNCRLLDAREAALNFVVEDGSHVLVLGFESADHPLEPWMERALALAATHGGRCPEGPRYRGEGGKVDDAGGATSWRSAFVSAPYLMNVLVSLGVVVDTFETACTWDRFPALYQGIVERVGETLRRVAGAGVLTCRFTHVYPDGPAPYFTFLAPGRPGGELDQWSAIKAAASDAILELGGTITHHHAVGRTHRPWYHRQVPDLFLDGLRAVKSAFDPAGILNPGVLLPP